MARFGFVGGSYTSQALNVDAQRTVNWYPEANDSQSKSALAMYPTPGLANFSQIVGAGSVPGLYTSTKSCRMAT